MAKASEKPSSKTEGEPPVASTPVRPGLIPTEQLMREQGITGPQGLEAFRLAGPWTEADEDWFVGMMSRYWDDE